MLRLGHQVLKRWNTYQNAVSGSRLTNGVFSLANRRYTKLSNPDLPQGAKSINVEVEEPSAQVSKIAEKLSKEPEPIASSAEKGLSAIDEARFIFNKVWDRIEKEQGGPEKMRIPAEIIWLMGSPGSGKGTNTPAIIKAREISNPVIVLSHLLKDPEIKKKYIDKGEMVSDTLAMEVLLQALLKSDSSSGVVVDGFPRTEIQVECLKLLYDKMLSLRAQFSKTSFRERFRKPVFRIVVLFIDEEESLKRQIKRGKMVKYHNARVRLTGTGELLKERATDYDENLIRARYRVFRQHFSSLTRLKKLFPFHLIHAVGSIEDVMRSIFKEFEYQSSLELDHETYDLIEHIPIAASVGRNARQELIRRLENYQLNNREKFQHSIKLIDEEFIPIIKRNSISGSTTVRINGTKLEDDMVIDMVMDVLSERGFTVSFDCRKTFVPVRVIPETWDIISETRSAYVFDIRFPKNQIRGTSIESDIALRDLANDVSETEQIRSEEETRKSQ